MALRASDKLLFNGERIVNVSTVPYSGVISRTSNGLELIVLEFPYGEWIWNDLQVESFKFVTVAYLSDAAGNSISTDTKGFFYSVRLHNDNVSVRWINISYTNFSSWPDSNGYVTIITYDYTKSFQTSVEGLFNGDFSGELLLVNEGSNSYKCQVNDLYTINDSNNGINRELLVNRDDKSYRITVAELLNEYASGVSPGQIEFSGTGRDESITLFTVPDGVIYISVVCVGGGGGGGAARYAGSGGGGGELVYRNKIKVIPGQQLEIKTGKGGNNTTAKQGGMGGDGGDTYIKDVGTGEYLCYAGGGKGGQGTSELINRSWSGGEGGMSTINVNGQIKNRGGKGGDGGGESNGADPNTAGGGGAPGSYVGTGAGGQNSRNNLSIVPSQTTGGAAGGDSAKDDIAHCGGGIGLKGKGKSATVPSGGGSGGTSEIIDPFGDSGGFYGGGGGASSVNNDTVISFYGGPGGARIIWPGDARQYPQTRTADE